ncbi:PhoH family protein [Pseudomonas sp.]|uniref:PhoH family protein n=1 Tax=Pseudomonas sp. TaxID=306 RepID=UPI003FD7DE5C
MGSHNKHFIEIIDGIEVEQPRKKTRRTRQGGKPTPTPRQQEQREHAQKLSPLKPMNEKQAEYIRLLNEKDMVIATGLPGTSKTFIPTMMACDLFRLGKIDRIIFSRPNISNSKSLGMFKGSAEEKMAQWLAPVISILNERIGVAALEIALKHGQIIFLPLETIKGFSAESCWFILNEAEDISRDEAKKLVTRQGKNCKLILAGDVGQSELNEHSGLRHLTDMVQKHPHLDVGFMDFDNVNDIVRSKQCKDWIIAYRKEEKGEV